jgi:ABC-type transport system substrate-binding protein
MSLRRLAATSLVAGALLAAIPARTSRRPHYGGTLRVEIGAAVNSLDSAAVVATPGESSVRVQIDSLVYDDRSADGTFTGGVSSGPFKISSFEPGKQLTLLANENFRKGRPFADAVDITMARPLRERLLDLELNKTDFTEIPAQETRHAAEHGVRTSQSQPDELLALVFLSNRPAVKDDRARIGIGQAVSLSIDRIAIVTYLLQKVGEPSGALLPQWASGTSFLFPTPADVPRAKELWSQITSAPKLVLGYDSADSLAQSVAERIVVNAKEAGISMTTLGISAVSSVASAQKSAIQRAPAGPDAMLVRVPMISPKPASALNDILSAVASTAGGGMSSTPLRDSASAQDIYAREREVIDTYRVVPLVWLPQVYGLGARVRNWVAPGPGEIWPLADVWLATDTHTTDNNKDQ